MTNKVGNYNPEFFANEALDQLYTQLGMARRVHRDIETDRNTAGRQRGQVVNMRRPGTFTAQDHVERTGTTGQDIEGQNVSITLDQHPEVKFSLTDVELAYTSERIIDEHIRPAAFALGQRIDSDLQALAAKVGQKSVLTGTVGANFITNPRKVLRGQGVNIEGGNVHYCIDTGLEAEFLNLPIFSQANTTGQGNNEQALMAGSLGVRFGVETFVSQNADQTVSAMTSTATKSDSSGDTAGAVNANTDVNSSTLAVKNFTLVETVQIGDTFTIAGDPTVYILTANTAFAAGAGTLTFYPALRKSAAVDAVVLFNELSATEEATHYRNVMFHRNAFALCFAPLPTTGDGRGAEIATVMDEATGITLRARMWYEGGASINWIALDALYGVQTLDGRYATRALRATTIAPA